MYFKTSKTSLISLKMIAVVIIGFIGLHVTILGASTLGESSNPIGEDHQFHATQATNLRVGFQMPKSSKFSVLSHSLSPTMVRPLGSGAQITDGGDWSGTNCLGEFYNQWIGPPDPQGMRSWKITANGFAGDGTLIHQVIYDKEWSAPNTDDYWEASFQINSAAFRSGSTLFLDASDVSWDGTQGEGHIKFKIINKALLLGNKNFPSAVATVDSISASCSKMNHWSPEHFLWGSQSIVANIPQYTVFYIDTDGNWTDFNSVNGINQPDPLFVDCRSTPEKIRPSNVTAAMVSKPTPQYNFVELFACNTVGNHWPNTDPHNGAFDPKCILPDFPNAFLGTGNITDRAFLGWDDTMEDGSTSAFDQGLYADLANGYTVYGAVIHNYRTKKPQGTDVLSRDALRFPKIFGDKWTKLNGLYQQNQPLNVWWFITSAGTSDHPHNG